MPQVIYKYDRHHIKATNLLANPIARIVADALSCTDEGGLLSSQDIEVEFQPFGRLDETRGYAVIIQIDANDYPSRRANIQERNNKIAEAVQAELKKASVIMTPDVSTRKAFVWTRLMPAGFTEFYL